MPDQRINQARNWLQKLGFDPQTEFQGVAGDASFRRYFRINTANRSLILMDAPPPGEDVRSFLDVAKRLRQVKLHAPDIVHSDEKTGFLLLEDLGDEMFRDLLEQTNAGVYFPGLFDILSILALQADASGLPAYDASMLREEMDLLPDWYFAHHRRQMSRTQFDRIWDNFCHQIIGSALEQPQCFVHRDFHSSNLLKTPDETIGIIDFQDAVKGPISYDFISLVWDRHITWPRWQLEKWMEDMRRRLDLDIGQQAWQRYCDLMGLQRNIKVVGIFARLNYRDAKSGYLEMIPRFYDYIIHTLRRYPEFSEMLTVLEQQQCVP